MKRPKKLDLLEDRNLTGWFMRRDSNMKRKKTVLGYGFKLSCEHVGEALSVYMKDGFCKTKKEVLEDIDRGKKSRDVPKKARPKLFKVIVEWV